MNKEAKEFIKTLMDDYNKNQSQEQPQPIKEQPVESRNPRTGKTMVLKSDKTGFEEKEQLKGGVWVKASERLPEGDCWIHTALGHNWFFQGVFYNNTFYQKKLNPIEWLDESALDELIQQNQIMKEALEKIAQYRFPEEIFTPVTEQEWKDIHIMLQKKFNMPIDRLSGAYGRLLLTPRIETANEALTLCQNNEFKKEI